MRDRNRIPEVLRAVCDLWGEYPDLRLGQLLTIVASYTKSDLFNLEDDALVSAIRGKASDENKDSERKSVRGEGRDHVQRFDL